MNVVGQTFTIKNKGSNNNEQQKVAVDEEINPLEQLDIEAINSGL